MKTIPHSPVARSQQEAQTQRRRRACLEMSGAFDKFKFILVNEKFLGSFLHVNMCSNISNLYKLHQKKRQSVLPSFFFFLSFRCSISFYQACYKKGKSNATSPKNAGEENNRNNVSLRSPNKLCPKSGYTAPNTCCEQGTEQILGSFKSLFTIHLQTKRGSGNKICQMSSI